MGHAPNSNMLSPRPAPGHATLLSHNSAKSSLQSGSSGRRVVSPYPSQTTAPQMISPRTNPGPQLDRPSNAAPGSYMLEALTAVGGGKYAAGADDYSGHSGLSEGYGRHSRSQITNLAAQPPSYGSRPTSGMLPPEAADMPVGLSMGPFLRAAIKSLTGQSLTTSPYNSDGGDSPAGGAASTAAAGYNAGAGMYSSSSSTGPQAGRLASGNGLSSGVSQQKLGTVPSCSPSASSTQSSFHVNTDLMPATMRMQQHHAVASRQGVKLPPQETAGAGNLEGSGSMFQSLWMQRLVAASQAQQQEDAMYGQQPR